MLKRSPENYGVPLGAALGFRNSLIVLTATAIIAASIAGCSNTKTQESEADKTKTVQVDGILTIDPSIFPIKVDPQTFDLDRFCQGEQVWDLPAGGTITVPKKCGDITIQDEKIETLKGSNTYGEIALNIIPEGDTVADTPDGEVHFHNNFNGFLWDLALEEDLNSCQQEQITWKEIFGNAIGVQWLNIAGIIPALTDRKLTLSGLTFYDNESIMILADGLGLGEYAQRIDDGKVECGGGLSTFSRLALLETNSGDTASKSIQDGVITQDEFCAVTSNAINLVSVMGNLRGEIARKHALQKAFSGICK